MEDDSTKGLSNVIKGPWRTTKTITKAKSEKVAIDISSQSVHSVKIEAESPLALYNIDIWGPYVAGAGSRTPTNDP